MHIYIYKRPTQVQLSWQTPPVTNCPDERIAIWSQLKAIQSGAHDTQYNRQLLDYSKTPPCSSVSQVTRQQGRWWTSEGSCRHKDILFTFGRHDALKHWGSIDHLQFTRLRRHRLSLKLNDQTSPMLNFKCPYYFVINIAYYGLNQSDVVCSSRIQKRHWNYNVSALRKR